MRSPTKSKKPAVPIGSRGVPRVSRMHALRTTLPHSITRRSAFPTEILVEWTMSGPFLLSALLVRSVSSHRFRPLQDPRRQMEIVV
jgi:hypothetical protein